MSLIFIMIKPVGIDQLYAHALQAKDPEELLKFSAPLVRAFKDLRGWTEQNGGEILCEFGEAFCCSISVDKISDFTQFIKKYEYTAKTNFAIGAGADPLEAFYAMQASEGDDGARIVLYSEDSEAMSKPLMGPQEDLVSKSEGGFDFPNLDLSEIPEVQEGQHVEAQPEGTDSVKQKVIEALMSLKNNVQVLAQIKQSSPEAFDSIKKMVDAMLALAKNPGETQSPQSGQPYQKPESKPKESQPKDG
jgi:hypothetical protein